MKTAISAVQPTGNLHIGNYLGSIARWKEFQEDYQCFFPIVDLHAITANFVQPKILKENIYKTLAIYLASGLDAGNSNIFQQSAVPAHSELFWILANVAQMGKLNRMTQFKDKSGKNKERASLGLYAYPVLMAADILIYDAETVPIGEDQLQHIELTNDIVDSFNHKYNTDILKEVQGLVLGSTKRIMSLKDASKKMSKSDDSDLSRINITDEADDIRKKISKAKTDTLDSFKENIDERPEVKNLLNIYSSFSGDEIEAIQNKYEGQGFQKFKSDLAEIIINFLSPVKNKSEELLADPTYLDSVLKDGAIRANEKAEARLKKIKEIVGF